MLYCDGWQYSKKYYWKQKFPARGITKVKHSYKPVPGWMYDYIKNDDKEGPYLDESCLDKQWCLDADMFRKWIKSEYNRKREQIFFYEINYILTTAKTGAARSANLRLLLRNLRTI
ncbi:MAG: DUF4424 family protein [Desulfobacteraceae bacterium]|nr:DUF4424 family protein [Desulfobacteraceae bacterium]